MGNATRCQEPQETLPGRVSSKAWLELTPGEVKGLLCSTYHSGLEFEPVIKGMLHFSCTSLLVASHGYSMWTG